MYLLHCIEALKCQISYERNEITELSASSVSLNGVLMNKFSTSIFSPNLDFQCSTFLLFWNNRTQHFNGIPRGIGYYIQGHVVNFLVERLGPALDAHSTLLQTIIAMRRVAECLQLLNKNRIFHGNLSSELIV